MAKKYLIPPRKFGEGRQFELWMQEVSLYINNLLDAGYAVGPSAATDNAIARFDGTGGKTLQNSGPTIDDSGNLVLSAKIYSTDWATYTPTWTGFDPATPGDWASAYYIKVGKLVFLHFNFYGTSDDVECKMTLPHNAVSLDLFNAAVSGWDNSTAITGACQAKITSADVSRVYFHSDMNSGGWTDSNKKGAFGQIWYIAA